MSNRYTTNMVDQYAINFAAWILDNGFQPSDSHPHKWMKMDQEGRYKQYTETQMLREFNKALEEEQEPCDHDYEPDVSCGKDIVVCHKCGDVI